MSISGWLLSIAGISVLSVLIDVILPSGQTSKYIRGIFAFFMVFVIVAPFPKLFGREFDIEKIFATQSIEIQKNFIIQINKDKLNLLENQIENELNLQNLNEIQITVNGDVFASPMEIKNIFVDLSNLVINENNKHINIKKVTKDCVKKFINIEEEKIVFNE